MLAEPARVLAVSPDAILLQTSRKATCGKCSAKQGCGQYLAGRDSEVLRLARTQKLPEGLVPGGKVVIGMPEGAIAGLALAFYALPLLTMLLFTAALSLFTTHEGWQVLGALCSLLAGLRIVPVVLRIFSRDGRCDPGLHVPVSMMMVSESFDEN